MTRHLILRLDAPLVAFGGVAVDNHGVTDAWPSASLITGLLASALGCQRTHADRLQRLQDRLVFACRLDRRGAVLRDFQTAELRKDDTGWTTRGAPEGRAGGAGTYEGMHIRWRDYWADRMVTVALRLDPNDETPTLDDVAAAIDHPRRPLFIGRKPCLPAARLHAGWEEAETALCAVVSAPQAEGFDAGGRPLLWWHISEPAPSMAASRHVSVYGRRNWRSDVHAGADLWCEGALP